MARILVLVTEKTYWVEPIRLQEWIYATWLAVGDGIPALDGATNPRPRPALVDVDHPTLRAGAIVHLVPDHQIPGLASRVRYTAGACFNSLALLVSHLLHLFLSILL